MANKPKLSLKKNIWKTDIDFSLAILIIILFGSITAYLMISLIK